MVTGRAMAPGPRALLRRLREVMAETGTVEERLSQVVRSIAANMVSEVCSVYLLRNDELELYATEGLNPEAVHKTRLKVGEGLVGDIAANARPLALADAQGHPQFAYKPETGEEIFHSLLGVPLQRDNRVIGVLVVQNKTRRQYAEDEVEVLETIAMVLAEMVASGQLTSPEDNVAVSRAPSLPFRADGRTLSEGLAIGQAVLHEPRVHVERTIADDIPHEKRRLDAAVASMRDQVNRMLEAPDDEIVGESRDVLETYKMFAHDSGWLHKLHQAVESGLTAEAAVLRVQGDTRHRMQAITDPYLRERLADLDDLANRLLLHLTGKGVTSAAEALPENAILFARAMGPAELLDYDRRKLQGLVLEEGSSVSHVAIVARALSIPVVGSVGRAIERVEPGDQVIVDGDHAQIFVRPVADVVSAFQQSLGLRKARLAKYAAQRDDPPITRDGKRVALLINAGLLIDLAHLDETGAEGIGLYRTELQFLVRPTMPKAEAQTAIYARVLEHAGDRPVVFRTLDVGGDKVLPYLAKQTEENPAMGWRAIRIALDRPALLKVQLRALLQAAEGRVLHVMFPMVAEVDEFIRARKVLDREVARLKSLGRPVARQVRVGTMLEVPALAWQLPSLLPLVDFVSVGSNDLMQFLFATDRGNPRMVDRYDPLAPSMLAFLRWVVQQCKAHDKPLTLCGEMGGRPLEAMALLGLGFERLSMPANAIGPVKEMLRSLDVLSLAEFLEGLYHLPDHSLRARLEEYARENGVIV
ncbi:phosphoenolpyruvate--protein phosphotransferase [Ferrovibrio sp.]|uniref:phosphoenolpyruvate--protein phosphotransferase n=1 Tax=Ferrovibrio sp. TaxID=1917215 RepID=UPI0025BFED4B|nr:phosphoenolpyruvate--protein phosphotransferase [Ferrovibrio sp.]MBX3455728.1 phosphoenolpyruvate--protein phosphotransferase [Ferrovibrio sp.]